MFVYMINVSVLFLIEDILTKKVRACVSFVPVWLWTGHVTERKQLTPLDVSLQMAPCGLPLVDSMKWLRCCWPLLRWVNCPDSQVQTALRFLKCNIIGVVALLPAIECIANLSTILEICNICELFSCLVCKISLSS